jgi:hypothetical protein
MVKDKNGRDTAWDKEGDVYCVKRAESFQIEYKVGDNCKESTT